MITKSQALVLRKIPYAENSAILQMYTQVHGPLSFLVNHIHGKSGKVALLQPGNFVELVYYYSHNQNLKRFKEISLVMTAARDAFDPLRMQLMGFCLEIIQKTIPEDNADPHTWEFIFNIFSDLFTNKDLKYFPHIFLLGFSEVLGHGVQTHEDAAAHNSEFLNKKQLAVCDLLNQKLSPELDRNERRMLLEKLLQYFHVHILPNKEIRSYGVLRELFD